MMNLTTAEENNLKKKESTNDQSRYIGEIERKKQTRTFATCPEGHELQMLYRRPRSKSSVHRIKGMFYCSRCEKVFKPAVVEVEIYPKN